MEKANEFVPFISRRGRVYSIISYRLQGNIVANQQIESIMFVVECATATGILSFLPDRTIFHVN